MKINYSKGLIFIILAACLDSIAFYMIATILPIYFVESIAEGGLGFDKSTAFSLFGSFFGFSYISPLIGGFFSDKFLGQFWTTVIGFSFIILGLGVLYFDQSNSYIWHALMSVALGYGFVRTCLTAMISSFHSKIEHQQQAYKIFHLSLAWGFAIASFVSGYVYTYNSFKGILTILFFVLFLCCLFFTLGARCNKTIEKHTEEEQPLKYNSKGMFIFFGLLVMSMPFFACYAQMYTSILTYLHENIDRVYFGVEIPATWINTIASVIMLCVMPRIVTKLQQSRDSVLANIRLGLTMTAIAFAFMALAAFYNTVGFMTTQLAFFALIAFLLIPAADLVIRPRLFSAILQYIPANYRTLTTAGVYVMIGISVKIGSALAAYVGDISFFHFFTIFMCSLLLLVCGTRLLERFLEKKLITA
jgi:proton-dependent oligopeptide transporter, POT family